MCPRWPPPPRPSVWTAVRKWPEGPRRWSSAQSIGAVCGEASGRAAQLCGECLIHAGVEPGAVHQVLLGEELTGGVDPGDEVAPRIGHQDRKSTRLNSSHVAISYAVFCLKKKKIGGV